MDLRVYLARCFLVLFLVVFFFVVCLLVSCLVGWLVGWLVCLYVFVCLFGWVGLGWVGLGRGVDCFFCWLVGRLFVCLFVILIV